MNQPAQRPEPININNLTGRCIVHNCPHPATHRRLTKTAGYTLPYCHHHNAIAKHIFGTAGEKPKTMCCYQYDRAAA